MVFGAPQTHEDDAERAIRAGLELEAAAQGLGLKVTIGINTGPVYFGRMGSETHREITVMGPVVNLAARLQSKAEPGQSLVGEATYRQTRWAFKFTPLSLEIKGVPKAVMAYLVERPRRQPRKIRGLEGLSTELIGREEELTKLKAALAQACQGRGQMAAIIGEAGLGKSRLVAELKQTTQQDLRFTTILPEAERSGIDDLRLDAEPKSEIVNPKSKIVWLEGRCMELGMTASYWPFADIFRAYFAFQPEDDELARAGRISTALSEMVEQDLLTVEQVEEIGPLLGNLLSLRFGHAWDDRLQHAGAEEIRHRTFQAVYDFLTALAWRQPLALVLEDLHWADGLSLDLISRLMEALPSTPLLLLCLYRPERQHKCWRLATIAARKCPAHFTELRLRELTPAQSRQLVEALLAIDDLPAPLKETILVKSQGNPFFVEEVIRALIDAGQLYQDGQVWRVQAGLGAAVVPESVQSVIQSRVDRLEPALKQVLQPAAVLGRLFRRQVLAQMISAETDLQHMLEALEEHALIYQERAVPEVEYSFKHVLTQEAIYQTILSRRRAELHRQAAAALEQLYPDSLAEYYEPLAYHYDRSDAVEKAIEYLLRAGEKARRASLNDEAMAYFRRVLERLDVLNATPQTPPPQPETLTSKPQPEWRLMALRGLGQIYYVTGQTGEAETYLRQAIALGQELGLPPRELVRLHFWLGEVLFWQSRYDEIIALNEAGLALLDNDPQVAEVVFLNAFIGNLSWVKGDMVKWREHSYGLAPLLQDLAYSEELRPAYFLVADVYYYDKRIAEAMQWLQEFERKATQHHDLRALIDVHFLAGNLVFCQGDIVQAISRFQQGLELSTKIEDTTHEAMSLERLGPALLALGNLQQAEAETQRWLETAEKLGEKLHMGRASWQMGKIYLSQGALEKAGQAFRNASQIFQEINSPVFRAEVFVSLGRTYLAQAQRQAAWLQFREAMTLVGPETLPLFEGWRPPFVGILSGLEAAYQDPGEFQAICRRYRQDHPETGNSSFVQWYLEPTILDFGFEKDNLTSAKGAQSEIQTLKWTDPWGDCSFQVGGKGLEIQAANGRDLWRLNLSAPRLLRPILGDFAVQTVCRPALAEKPAIGGILLWQDQENYIRLDRGVLGEGEILYGGCFKNKDGLIGRGRLPEIDPQTSPVLATGEVWLRLERVGRRVRALSSANGVDWFSVGEVEFPVKDSLEVGLHAIGAIDRTIYHDAFPEGTAIRFESFQVWRRADQV